VEEVGEHGDWRRCGSLACVRARVHSVLFLYFTSVFRDTCVCQCCGVEEMRSQKKILLLLNIYR
jgi:hypothetical protein